MDEATKKRMVELGTGDTVESDVLGVVEEICRRWPMLSVQYLDPGRASDITDAPYRIVEHCNDGLTRVVFTVWELDKRVLDRIEAADTNNQDILAVIDKHNKAVRRAEAQRFKEKRIEDGLKSAAILASDKSSYTAPVGNRLIKFHEDRPAEVIRDNL